MKTLNLFPSMQKRIDFIFVVKHYANDVEYSTKGMVSKTKITLILNFIIIKNSSRILLTLLMILKSITLIKI